MKKFPNNFLWGSATSAYQVEGGIEDNDWAEAARLEKLPEAGKASNHYNLYEKDFDIAKELNQNAHRFSIEWSRIEPEVGIFDQKEIEHYKSVLRALKERGIEPFVTIYHWPLPIWFGDRGGWLASDSDRIFARYVEKLANEFKGLVKYWITINEPLIYASAGFRKGTWPPFQKNFFTFVKVTNQLAVAHRLAYERIKEIDPQAQIGVAKNNIFFEANDNIFNKLAAKIASRFWNDRFLNSIAEHQDFIGLNYYFHKKFGDKKKYEKNDMGWDIYPKGIYKVLKHLNKYGKPIYITENGIPDANDKKRGRFIKDHLKWVHKAIEEGVDVEGYFYWSLIDNYEWDKGFGPRFGLVEVDYSNFKREIRPSAFEYAKMCKNNGME